MVVHLIVRGILRLVMLGLLLFLPAGTWHWMAAWIYFAEMTAVGATILVWLAKRNPGLLKERLSPLIQKKQPTADKVFMGVLFASFCAWCVLIAFDAVRYGWSDMSAWIQASGAFCLLLHGYITFLTFRANSFAAPVIKIQEERGQTVVTTGPYRYIRHPMYAGAIFFFLGTPLLLGSWWGFLLAPIFLILLSIRILHEERMLRAELHGYTEYAARVRYRLIPLVW